MAIAVVSFFSGTRLYRNQKPGGSPLARISQVIVVSFRKLHVKVPADKSLLYETADEESVVQGSCKLDHTETLSFVDKAAAETERYSTKGMVNPWMLCTVTQVEELKSLIRLLPIWATGIIFVASFSQMNTLFAVQGSSMTFIWVLASRSPQHLFPYSIESVSSSGQTTRITKFIIPNNTIRCWDSTLGPSLRKAGVFTNWATSG